MSKYANLVLVLTFASSLLVGCSGTPAEEYVDYFYSKPSDGGGKIFTYILYLGEEGKSLRQHQKDHSSISPRDENERMQNNQRRTSRAKKGEEFTSLSFRMEEEAFKRIKERLTKSQYCAGEVEYLESEYTWLRYTIKGRCNT